MKKLILLFILMPTIGFCQFGIYDVEAPNFFNKGLYDLDSDGDLDFVGISSGKIHWKENQGNFTFTNNMEIIDSNVVNDFVIGDIDNDGDNDIIVSYRFEQNIIQNIELFFNDGNQNFGNATVISDNITKINLANLYLSDVDNDGNLDFICFLDDGSNGGGIFWMKGFGNGTFNPREMIASSAPATYTQVVIEDLDGDNLKEVVFKYWQSIAIYSLKNGSYNNNSGLDINTKSVRDYGYSKRNISFDVIDTDNDGDLDILSGVSRSNNTIQDDSIFYFENLGNLRFSDEKVYFNTPEINEFYSFDSNGDSLLDLLIIGKPSTKYKYFSALFVNEGQKYNPIPIYSIDSNSTTNPIFSFSYDYGDIDDDGDVDISAMLFIDTIKIFESFVGSPFQYSGKTFYDQNENKTLDSLENGLSFFKMTLNSSEAFSLTNQGNYRIKSDSGINSISFKPLAYWKLTTDSSTYNKSVNAINPEISGLNFGFSPDTIVNKIETTITSSFPRCNTVVNVWVNLKNTGTTNPNTIITLQLDDSLNFISSNVSPISVNGNSIQWEIDSLDFFVVERINLKVQMPDFRSIGRLLRSTLIVNQSSSNSASVKTDTANLLQELRCAYDPNDKTAFIGGIKADSIIPNDTTLEYLIRFQNTGNDTSLNVVVRDRLDINLDWETFELISTSHSVELNMENNGELVFDFQNIFLVDSNTNEPESHGFIRYRIKTKNNLNPNSRISNTADIYFDFNPAIVTNTVQNYIECYDTSYIPLIRQVNGVTLEVDIENAKSFQWFKNDSILVGETNKRLTISDSGRYKAYIQDSLGCFHFSEENHFFTNGLKQIIVAKAALSPNPFNNELTITFYKTISKNLTIEIYDVKGRLIRLGKAYVNKKHVLFKENLTPGLYVLKVQDDQEVLLNQKILVE